MKRNQNDSNLRVEPGRFLGSNSNWVEEGKGQKWQYGGSKVQYQRSRTQLYSTNLEEEVRVGVTGPTLADLGRRGPIVCELTDRASHSSTPMLTSFFINGNIMGSFVEERAKANVNLTRFATRHFRSGEEFCSGGAANGADSTYNQI